MFAPHAGWHNLSCIQVCCCASLQSTTLGYPHNIVWSHCRTVIRRAGSTGFGKPLADLAEADRPVLPPRPDLKGLRPESRWNATALAFLGDSVWELYLRSHFFYPPTRLTQYYKNVQEKVCAEAQAIIYEILQSGQFLTGAEREILRWGHNAKVVVPKRFHASGKHIDIYKQATAVECLIGYLYLTESERLHQLMQYLLSTLGALTTEGSRAA